MSALTRFPIILIGMVMLSLCPFFTPQAAAQQDKYPRLKGMDYGQLETELKNAQLFRVLGSSKRAIDGLSRCGRNLEEVKQSRKTFDRLKAENDRNPTAENKRLAEKWQKAIDKEIQYYKDCFTNNLSGFTVLQSANIYSYPAHRARHKSLGQTYGKIDDINGYIAEVEYRMHNYGQVTDDSAPTDVVAVLANVHRTVEVLPGGRGNRWRKVDRGYNLRLADHVRTGPRGRARIKFADYDSKYNAGPTVVNMGSSTLVKMQSFNIKVPRKRDGVIDLIRGSLRTFSKNLGPKSSFRVRMGASICGIRGTEAGMSYNPDTGVADIHLDHGDAYVAVGSRQTTLQPRTSVTVRNNQVSSARPLLENTWNTFVRSSGAGYSETQATARAGLGRGNGIQALLPLSESQPAAPAAPNRFSDIYDGFRERQDNEYYDKIVARVAVKNFLRALQSETTAHPQDVATGEYLEILKGLTKTQTIAQWAKSSQQAPRNYTIKCSVCDPATKTCRVDTHVERLIDPPGQGVDIVFDTKILPGKNADQKVSMLTGNKDKVSTFRRNNPNCSKF